MPETVKKRCVIYTRKSVEDGLEQEFNSLDAQREAGEAYIASQKGNGWICLPERYDDGGTSGGNMNRPALKRLLGDCEAGLIDIIVVYKIDRLSRSICDFADLTKKFDNWRVNFVAVTQEINTSTSSGRMMLNILITFAQYEREVITERVRDKMSASRKKGMWVGGSVPYGYKVVNKKLVIVPEDAEIIKGIFQRFVEVQSTKLVAAEINHRGIRTKKGHEWNLSHIYRILNNHTYIGEVNYKNNIFKGEHDGFIDPLIWKRVHEIMAGRNPHRHGRENVKTVAPLQGLLRCGHCECAMVPTYSKKNSRKYFYYICGKDMHRAESICPVRMVPAGDVESLVKDEFKRLFGDAGFISQLAMSSDIRAVEIIGMLDNEFWSELSPGEYNRLAQLLLEKAIITAEGLELEIKTAGIKSLMEDMKNAED